MMEKYDDQTFQYNKSEPHRPESEKWNLFQGRNLVETKVSLKVSMPTKSLLRMLLD